MPNMPKLMFSWLCWVRFDWHKTVCAHVADGDLLFMVASTDTAVYLHFWNVPPTTGHRRYLRHFLMELDFMGCHHTCGLTVEERMLMLDVLWKKPEAPVIIISTVFASTITCHVLVHLWWVPKIMKCRRALWKICLQLYCCYRYSPRKRLCVVWFKYWFIPLLFLTLSVNFCK